MALMLEVILTREKAIMMFSLFLKINYEKKRNF